MGLDLCSVHKLESSLMRNRLLFPKKESSLTVRHTFWTVSDSMKIQHNGNQISVSEKNKNIYLNLIWKLNIFPRTFRTTQFLRSILEAILFRENPYNHLILFRVFSYGRKFPEIDCFCSGCIVLLQVSKNEADEEMNWHLQEIR